MDVSYPDLRDARQAAEELLTRLQVLHHWVVKEGRANPDTPFPLHCVAPAVLGHLFQSADYQAKRIRIASVLKPLEDSRSSVVRVNHLASERTAAGAILRLMTLLPGVSGPFRPEDIFPVEAIDWEQLQTAVRNGPDLLMQVFHAALAQRKPWEQAHRSLIGEPWCGLYDRLRKLNSRQKAALQQKCQPLGKRIAEVLQGFDAEQLQAELDMEFSKALPETGAGTMFPHIPDRVVNWYIKDAVIPRTGELPPELLPATVGALGGLPHGWWTPS